MPAKREEINRLVYECEVHREYAEACAEEADRDGTGSGDLGGDVGLGKGKTD